LTQGTNDEIIRKFFDVLSSPWERERERAVEELEGDRVRDNRDRREIWRLFRSPPGKKALL